MPDELNPSSGAPPDSTDVRFSLRSLLIATVPVALIAGVLGKFFRNIDPAERTQVVAQWGLCAVFVGLLIGYHMRTRLELERTAGRKILELSPHVRLFPNRKPWTRYVGGALLIAMGPSYLLLTQSMAQKTPGLSLQMWLYFFRVFLSAGMIGGGVAQLWWNRAVQLREHGVLYGLRLLRWDHVTDFRWEPELLRVEGVDQRHNDVRFPIIVPSNARATVEAVLAERLNGTDNSLGSSGSPIAPPDGVAIPAIRLSTRRELAARGCLTYLVAYVIGITLLVLSYLILGRVTQPPEFVQGAVVGFIANAVIVRILARGHQKAGSPRIRLDLSLDGSAILLMIAATAACCYASNWLPFSHPWLIRCLGLGCGAAVFSFIGLIARDKLDLCDKGIVIRRWLYWPWEGTRIRRWNRDDNGRLVLCRGWRRVVAKVPPEQREAVDAVLKEKLGEKTPTKS